MTNPYLDQIHRTLPRLLALYDRNPLSATYGLGDRLHWAWKLIDFANGTYQGAAHGLARLLAAGLLPDWFPEPSVLRRIDGCFAGAEAIRRANGSMEEAFPFESSYCVTALVAYDLLSAIELLGARLEPARRERYLSVVAPMIAFVRENDETHAFISNHLATAAAALAKWDLLHGDKTEAPAALWRTIAARQSTEGWYLEYEGADPGYMTLALYYLADLHRMRPDLEMGASLRRAVAFLTHFAHPDGSFGGLYGSRNTRFCIPAGLEVLAAGDPAAAALARFARGSIAAQTMVTLEAIDEPNLIPVFNAYCWAAAAAAAAPEPNEVSLLPMERSGALRSVFKEAGLLVDKGASGYTVISFFKGGVLAHFPADRSPARIDPGPLAIDAAANVFSAQTYRKDAVFELEGDTVHIDAPLEPVGTLRPNALNFIALRLLNVSVMRYRPAGELVKQALVKLLITRKRRAAAVNRRTIVLKPAVHFKDDWVANHGALSRIEGYDSFSAIHMASQGYWQRQDELG